jgi:hypothetical protein
MSDAEPEGHETRHLSVPPDQSDVRPSERQIGVGIRTDGPNGQSSTAQQPGDSMVELQGAGERLTARREGQGEAR